MSGNNSAELIPIYNEEEPSNSIISINVSGVTKLTPTNYLTWKLQVYALFEAHELHHFLTETDETPARPNPKHARQDKMLYSSLISTLSPPVQPFVARATTARDVWLTLARTYGQPSRRHIKELKQRLRSTRKGSQTITEYMGSVMTKADHLALLGAPVDHEDLLDIIVDGLGKEYGAVTEMVVGRDVPMTIEELHEKLLNRENALKASGGSRYSILDKFMDPPAEPNFELDLLDNNQRVGLFFGVMVVIVFVGLIVADQERSRPRTRF